MHERKWVLHKIREWNWGVGYSLIDFFLFYSFYAAFGNVKLLGMIILTNNEMRIYFILLKNLFNITKPKLLYGNSPILVFSKSYKLWQSVLGFSFIFGKYEVIVSILSLYFMRKLKFQNSTTKVTFASQIEF